MTTQDQEARGLVPAAAWLNDERLQMGSRIYEDSIRQTHYNSVLTILTINDPVSDHEQDDDDSLLEVL